MQVHKLAATDSCSGLTILSVDASALMKNLAQEKVNTSTGRLATVLADPNAVLQGQFSIARPAPVKKCAIRLDAKMGTNGTHLSASVFQSAATS